jgi:hypothetical protein
MARFVHILAFPIKQKHQGKGPQSAEAARVWSAILDHDAVGGGYPAKSATVNG